MPHGTRGCYVRGCRRPSCKSAAREYAREYGREYRKLTNVKPETGIEPVARHINGLKAAGMGVRAIAERAGVSTGTVARIAGSGSVANSRGVRIETARKILAVTPDPAIRSALGSRRRVRALAAMGWSQREIVKAAGINYRVLGDVMSGAQSRLHRTSALAIESAYLELSMRQGPSSRARSRAESKGWAPPLAWDDIDDPNERPSLGDRSKSRGADIDEWLFLVGGGDNPERAAARLGVQVDAIAQQAYRKGRQDVLDIAWPVAQQVKNRRARQRAA